MSASETTTKNKNTLRIKNKKKLLKLIPKNEQRNCCKTVLPGQLENHSGGAGKRKLNIVSLNTNRAIKNDDTDGKPSKLLKFAQDKARVAYPRDNDKANDHHLRVCRTFLPDI